MLAGEDLTFDGSAETDAKFLIYGGRGTDDLTGGAGNDIFFFAEGGRFAAGDTVDGGGGYDGLFLRGNYTIDFTQAGYAGALANIENLDGLRGRRRALRPRRRHRVRLQHHLGRRSARRPARR